jgi:hypothetical protein
LKRKKSLNRPKLRNRFYLLWRRGVKYSKRLNQEGGSADEDDYENSIEHIEPESKKFNLKSIYILKKNNF